MALVGLVVAYLRQSADVGLVRLVYIIALLLYMRSMPSAVQPLSNGTGVGQGHKTTEVYLLMMQASLLPLFSYVNLPNQTIIWSSSVICLSIAVF
jgi:hypothetical protein